MQQSGPKRRKGKITRSVTHIRLAEANNVKLSALDAVAAIYLALCQQYVTYFCTEAEPDKYHDPIFETSLSERWHQAALRQAAGIAQSWRTNRERAYQGYCDDLLDYHDRGTEGR